MLLLELLLVLAGCRPVQGSTLSAMWTIDDTGITLSPPGAVTPTVSANAAFDLCRLHIAACNDDDPTAVQLAVMTDTSSNMVEPGTLVWAISWLGTTSCGVSGGGPVETPSIAPVETPAAAPTPLCDKIAFIDATTDAFYFTETFPHQ
jgi:hypothetical protein